MFIGREEELSLLRTIQRAPGSHIVVVYGRRRIGKSSLIHEAFSSHPTLSFEGLENQSTKEQIDNFLFQLQYQTKKRIKRKSSIKKWREALMELVPFVQDQPSLIIVLDELQWMANSRFNLVSDLKMVWDQYLAKAGNVTLVLCGSVASFMVKKVLQSKALYGRADRIISLKPFTLHETSLLLSDRGNEEVILAHLLVGGVPKYLELLKNSQSILQAVGEHAYSETGYFFAEYQRIFVSHFGSSSNYEKLLRILANKSYGLSRQQLHSETGVSGGGEMTRLLYDLESAGFIASYRPYDKGKTSKIIRYLLTDFYIRFYLSFIEPHNTNQSLSASQAKEYFVNYVVPSPAFQSWLGLSFEFVCLEHASQIAQILGFSGIQYNVGPYFRHSRGGTLSGVQIDLLFARSDKVFTVCEMKYQDRPIGIEVGKALNTKIEKVPSLVNKAIQKVLVSKSEPTCELLRSGIFSKIILAHELIDTATR